MRDSIVGLNVAIPGSSLMANVTKFSNKPDRSSRVFRPGHSWTVERRRAPALSFSDTASLMLEIKVMGWIHRLSNPISVPLPINLMNNNYEINRFYNLIKKLPPPGFPSEAACRRHNLIRGSGQDRHRRANSNALK
jgi:hypothetical protein